VELYIAILKDNPESGTQNEIQGANVLN